MRSIIADSIVKEYKMKKIYERMNRHKCKEKDCERCRFKNVCNENKSLEELEEQL